MDKPSLSAGMNHKHCFWCQTSTSTKKNLLKETVGGNFIHRECIKQLEWLDSHSDKPFIPQVKRKRAA